jgi:hypothetical protein
MDVQVANELVAMRHEQLAHSRGHEAGATVRRTRLQTVRRGWLSIAMRLFGAGVVAPKVVAPKRARTRAAGCEPC